MAHVAQYVMKQTPNGTYRAELAHSSMLAEIRDLWAAADASPVHSTYQGPDRLTKLAGLKQALWAWYRAGQINADELQGWLAGCQASFTRD